MSETTPQLPSRLAMESHRYELSLGDYWRIIIKRRMIVLITFASVLTSTIIYTNSQTPLYEANSAVRVAINARAFQDGGVFVPQIGDIMSTYANLILSNDVMERVVLRLGLLSPEATVEDLSDKSDEIRDSISVRQSGDTGVIRISVVYQDPELAAAIANQSAEAFVEVDLLQKTKQARNLRRFIESQLALFTKKLGSTETEMKEFKEEGRNFGLATGLEQELSLLEKERSFLLKQFTDRHPDVIKVNDEIARVEKRLREIPTDALDMARMQRELEINDSTYRMMKDKYESARLAEAEQVSDITVIQTASIPRTPISPQKKLNKMLGSVVGLILGVILAFLNENIDTSIGTIEDVERTVRLPVIGIVPFFDPHHEQAPWWRIDRQFFNIIHKTREKPPDSEYLIMNQDTFSTLAEAYRILRTFVEFLMEKKTAGGKIILFTSTGPQEGKTLTTSNLAISLAQAGKKTLLIDADLRRPMVHRLFGLKRSPGLSDVLLGTISLAEARRTMGDILVGENSKWDQLLTSKMLDRLEILVAGTYTQSPAELLGSDEMKNLIEHAHLRYDYILVDTPPVLPVTDARTIGPLADATFFVYRAGKTARRALTRAREELNLAGVKVKGIILNQATPEVTLTDSYYYQYYGETKEEREARGNE